MTRKIAAAAVRIARGAPERLVVGRLDIIRDWGWAPEYIEAMWKMLQQPSPKDYVIATGESNSLQDFVAAAFQSLGLDWRKHVDSDRALFRPTDLQTSYANPELAARELGWRATRRMSDVVREMVAAESA